MKFVKPSLIFFSAFVVTSLVIMQGCGQTSVPPILFKDPENSPSVSPQQSPTPITQETYTSGNTSTTSPSPSHRTTQPLSLEQQEQIIQKSLDRLETGAFFHNIPQEMRVNNTTIIEAGITDKVTNELLQDLQRKGKISVKENVRYNPLAANIQLKADSNEFDIRAISVGTRPPIVNGKPVIWTWTVTPRRQGTYFLVLTATGKIKVPEIERDYIKEYIVYKEPVKVQVNIGYSIQKFLVNYWWEVLGSSLIILFGLYAWKMSLKPKVKQESIVKQNTNQTP